MSRPDLPADLADVERRLRAGRGPAPSSAHRARVLAAVGDALAARRLPWFRRPVVWQTAAAAAVVVLWANVAVSTLGRPFAFPSDAGNGQALRAGAVAIRTVAPQLSEEEARRQALLLRAGAAGAALPRSAAAPGEGSGFTHWKEVHSWGSP